ncbi:MAG: PIN domain-containing protein [Hormoscilla sp. GUM202]|nr:PIN domain-containing protein [Hormoscilla sp. GM7CHS1pb]MBO1349533.1 PIN domain-containing protein [Hormoscilla sp. GUM202]
MKLKVYLDTSVFSAYYDDNVKERQTQTHEFWSRLSEFDVATSELARQELSRTSDLELRQKLLNLLEGVTIYPITPEIIALANKYIEAGVFTGTMFNDAAHIAAAVLNNHDFVLAWNFKHLVNLRRKAKVNEVNVSLSLRTIEIIAPPEI